MAFFKACMACGRPLEAAWPAFRSKAHPVSMDQRLAEVSKSLQVPGRIEGRTMGMHIYIKRLHVIELY